MNSKGILGCSGDRGDRGGAGGFYSGSSSAGGSGGAYSGSVSAGASVGAYSGLGIAGGAGGFYSGSGSAGGSGGFYSGNKDDSGRYRPDNSGNFKWVLNLLTEISWKYNATVWSYSFFWNGEQTNSRCNTPIFFEAIISFRWSQPVHAKAWLSQFLLIIALN